MTVTLGGPLLLVGAGKMGGALLAGWLRQGLDPALVYVQDPTPAPEVAALMASHGIRAAPSGEIAGGSVSDGDRGETADHG